MTKSKLFNAKNVNIIGTKEGRTLNETFKNQQQNIKVFEKNNIRYTGQLVHDPKFGNQLRNIRKNKKAYVLTTCPYTYNVTRK